MHNLLQFSGIFFLCIAYTTPVSPSLSQVTLVERGTSNHFSIGQDLETVFSLSPVIQEGDTVLFESYARIKHLATRTWLHLDKSRPSSVLHDIIPHTYVHVYYYIYRRSGKKISSMVLCNEN